MLAVWKEVRSIPMATSQTVTPVPSATNSSISTRLFLLQGDDFWSLEGERKHVFVQRALTHLYRHGHARLFKACRVLLRWLLSFVTEVFTVLHC